MIPAIPSYQDDFEPSPIVVSAKDLPFVVYRLMQTDERAERGYYRQLALALSRLANITNMALLQAIEDPEPKREVLFQVVRTAQHPWLAPARLWATFADLATIPMRWDNHLEGPWFYRRTDRRSGEEISSDLEHVGNEIANKVFAHAQQGLDTMYTLAAGLILAWGGSTISLEMEGVPLAALIAES